jgi:predicted ATPase/DNA-binding SARP family transcriptional activator/ABC-type glycerol-3-phosphate transport system substrate-binding protein
MLELRLLGYPSATLDGIPLSDALLHKELALLYYLAASGQPQPRTSLTVLLWGDHSEAAARGNLRKSLSNLRQHLGEHIVAERDRVELVQPRCTVDLWKFEELASNGLAASDQVQLQAAAALYRGDFLAGFTVRNAVDYDRWLYNLQERLRGQVVYLLTTLAKLHTNTTDLAPAIAVHRRILELEPWREESHRELMLLLARSGQRGAALAQYNSCVEVLAAELGVEPDQETTTLAERIRTSALPMDWPVETRLRSAGEASQGPAPSVPADPAATGHLHGSLAPELAPIVGRAKELDELSEMLWEPECRLVTILGEGGIGKTRLALALAHRLTPEYAHVAMVPLANVAGVDEILSAIGRALGIISGRDGDAVLGVLHSENPHLLLVLDNFEHLLPEGVVVLEQLLGRVPRLRCLVTSREALSTRWEWRYQVKELSFPAEPAEDDPTAFSSVQLFRQIARRTRARQAIEGAELREVMRICRAVGGMPLGIELAAAQVGSLSCAAIADQLAAGIERLTADRRDLPVRQRSMLASFDASWATLSPHEQNVLARLSVFHGEFTFEAALGIAEATATDIIRLVEKSLLRSGGDFYSLHEVIKQHAARKLELVPGAPAAAFAAYGDYYTAWVQRNLHRLTTDQMLRRRIAATEAENHLQHLWHIWVTGKGQPDRNQIAIALTNADQNFRAHVQAGTLSSVWMDLEAFVGNHTRASPAYSGVLSIDVVWLPTVADQLADITAELAMEIDSLIPEVVKACCLGGRLLAFPIDTDLGLLYYRSDLLGKYGFAAPPVTWDELEHMAAVIQTGERAAGHRDFWGFIWPGHQSESLTCTALEWQHSEGGGCIIEPDGRISIANERAAAALARAARWVGNISPPDFGDHSEYHTVRLWESGDAAFMRIWGAFSVRQLHNAVQPLTAVTVLPRGAACHAATMGGSPLAIHVSLRQREDAIDLVKAMGSPEVQRLRAQHFDGVLPAILALYHDPALQAVHPFLADVHKLITTGGLAVRPCTVAGTRYAQVSTLYAETVATILRKEGDALPALQCLERELAELGGWSR